MKGEIILKALPGEGEIGFSKEYHFSKRYYTLEESRDFVKIFPIHDKDRIMKFYKIFWKVVKQ